jgi:hypothetical protein
VSLPPAPSFRRLTLEVHTIEPEARLTDADQAVLDVCRELQAIGASVIFATGDTGMTVRAWSAGLRVVALSEKYLRKRAGSGEE